MNEVLHQKIARQFRNTQLGLVRIRRNLKLGDVADKEVENLLRSIILSTEPECIESKGKNYYLRNSKHNAVLTINRHSFTVITAKQMESKPNGSRTPGSGMYAPRSTRASRLCP